MNDSVSMPSPEYLARLAQRKCLLAIATLFENEFTIDWLAELTGLKAHSILSELQEEVERKNLSSPRPGIFSICSNRIRTRWRSGLSPGERELLSRRIIDLMVQDLPDNESKWVSLSYHLLRVKNNMGSCRFLCRAGDVYRKSFQTDLAFQCYSKVLEDLTDLSGEEADCLFIETSVKYSKVSTARHDTNHVLAILYNALKRAQNRDNLPFQSLLETHIAKNEWLCDKYDHAMDHFKKGWALAKKIEDPQIVRAVTMFGPFFLYWQGRFREAVESYEQTVSEVENYPNAHFPLLGTMTAGYCYTQLGQYTQGLGMLDGIRAHCLERGDLYLASQTIGNIGEIMLGLRRLDDALDYLKLSMKMAIEANNYWVLVTVNSFLAYAYYLKGEDGQALSCLKKFIKNRQKARALVHPYPYLVALSWAIKQGELSKVEGVTVENEVTCMIGSQNIFARGLGYRYQAFLLQQEGNSPENVIEALENSIKWLNESGHYVELCRSRLELARFFLSLGRNDLAQKLTSEVSLSQGAFDEALIPDDIRSLVGKEENSERLLQEILKLGQELVLIQNNQDLLKRIIYTSNRLAGAERGAIFLLEKDESGSAQVTLKASKNLLSDQINQSNFTLSLKMIEEAFRTGKGSIVCDDSGKEQDYSSQGGIRSRIFMPMILRDQVVGVLYHDNRLVSNAFKEPQFGLLAYFAALAAIALDNVRAYEELNLINQNLEQEEQYYKEEHFNKLHFDEILGKSPAIQRVLDQIEQVAKTDTTVLITGETGVGKDLVARAIHYHGLRAEKPFIGVQLNIFPETLLASELLGHEKGAFTGATNVRVGRFELADGGTLFLDEISEISSDIQARLLRVLQTREFERIGGTKTLSSDFRVIAATNRDLAREVREGRFRADLYYRLNIFPIHVPPLRERIKDIPIMVRHFLNFYAVKLGKVVENITDEDMQKLMQYNWPGNVRELQNFIEQGVVLSVGKYFRMPELNLIGRTPADQDDIVTLAENERRHILRILQKTNWKMAGQGGAAEILGIPPSTLSFRMNKLSIKRPGARRPGGTAKVKP